MSKYGIIYITMRSGYPLLLAMICQAEATLHPFISKSNNIKTEQDNAPENVNNFDYLTGKTHHYLRHKKRKSGKRPCIEHAIT